MDGNRRENGYQEDNVYGRVEAWIYIIHTGIEPGIDSVNN